MSQIIMVYITLPSKEKAKEIAQVLLEKHLIACATMLPCESIYRWEGAIQNEQEFIMFAKTTEDKFELLEDAINNMHPYDIPCILKINTTANAAYARWVYAEVNPT